MAAISTDFLEIDDELPRHKQQRSRSSGHVDYLEEQARADRRVHERQMKRYHDSTRHVSTTHQRTRSDYLTVPVFEVNRGPRTSERIEQQRTASSRRFKVEEVRPGPRPVSSYDLNTEPVLPSQLPVPHPGRQQPEKPKIKVPPVIIQENPPSPSRRSERSSRRSPSASPHSPTAQPELQFQYDMLQRKLAKVCECCTPYLDVEPANPQDLTFAKIKETVEGFAFDLHVWSHVANLDGLAMVDRDLRILVEAASGCFDNLLERAKELRDTCATVKPKDLKVQPLHVMDDGDTFELYDDDEGDMKIEDPTESPGFVIQSLLHSIKTQIQNLRLLSPSLQEATPDAEEEMINVARLVKEAGKYFGSDDALKLFSIDSKYAGRKAFEEARYAAAQRR